MITPMMPLTLAAYFHDLDPIIFHVTETWGPRWYGLAYGVGFLLTYWSVVALAKRGKILLTPVQAGDFILYVAAGVMLGGRVGYATFYDHSVWGFSDEAPYWNMLALNRGGMASHGGIIGVIVACWLFHRKYKIVLPHLFDLTVLAGPLGLFLGRIANFINGELLGRPCDPALPWAVKFPQEVLERWTVADLPKLGPVVQTLPQPIDGTTWQVWSAQLMDNAAAHREIAGYVASAKYQIIHAVQQGSIATRQALEPLLTTRHPSQLYAALLEGLAMSVLCAIVWARPRKPGVTSGAFLIGYAIVRIIDEQFRLPDLEIGFQWLGLTRGQWLSVAMLLAGVAYMIHMARRPAQKIGGWLTPRSA